MLADRRARRAHEEEKPLRTVQLAGSRCGGDARERAAQAPGRVLFGTNYPMITPQKALEDLDALRLDDEARDRFLEGNARRVFGLD
ncbi:MAG TPA: amidohydrolase family protein [Gaiellaceae bacterium]